MSARDKYYKYCISKGHVKVKLSPEKKNLLKHHIGQYHFKVPFMLYVDFEIILKPVDEQYRETTNKMTTKRKGKTHIQCILYSEGIYNFSCILLWFYN